MCHDLSRIKAETEFHELSMSRMGFFGDREIAQSLFDRFKAKGLAKQSKDGVSIPLHPAVRYSILVLLAQILRPQGPALGLDLSPATDRFEIVQALTELLNVPTTPSAGHVVAFDLQYVSVDLSAVPLDEVLGFRAENSRAHREYVTSVRQFTRELSLISEADRAQAFQERQAQLDDLANDLKRTARKVWKRPASFGLTLAGAAWTYHSGDLFGALLAAAGGLMGLEGAPANEAGAYSYLFAAHQRYA